MKNNQPTITQTSGQYGAPMGRAEWLPCNAAPRTVRVFKVTLNSGGYDIGGAYWGTGNTLYCATDSMLYREFLRAKNRAAAIVGLGIDSTLLIKGSK